jgi:hypothetical protein
VNVGLPRLSSGNRGEAASVPTQTQTHGGSGCSSSSRGKGKYRGKPHGRGNSSIGGGGSAEGRSGANPGRAATRNDVCKLCGKRGHWAKDCRSRPRREQAHVAHDDEEALMYIKGISVDLNTSGRSRPIAPHRETSSPRLRRTYTPPPRLHHANQLLRTLDPPRPSRTEPMAPRNEFGRPSTRSTW